MRPAILLLIAAAALASCAGPRRSPHVRITGDDGRIYIARGDRLIQSGAAGFLSFRDLVTGESVRLLNGTYTIEPAEPGELMGRQMEYMDDPSKPPSAEPAVE